MKQPHSESPSSLWKQIAGAGGAENKTAQRGGLWISA